MSRGRPPIEDTPPPRQYTREFTDSDGSVSVWYYDLDKFERSSILPSKKVFTWKQAKSFNKYFLTKEQSKYF